MFEAMTTIPYKLDGYNKEAMNILTAAIVKHINVDQSYIYQSYVVPAGTTPESLAEKMYGDSRKYWVILLVNAIVNPFLEWVMDAHTLEEYTKAVYSDIDTVLYFTNLQTGRRYDDVASETFFSLLEAGDPLPHDVHPVGPLEHEAALNAKRAEIVLINPRYVHFFVDTFNRSIQGTE